VFVTSEPASGGEEPNAQKRLYALGDANHPESTDRSLEAPEVPAHNKRRLELMLTYAEVMF
jgi:hypothetical protein